MRTLKLTLAYDGTDFVGWQAQAVVGRRTVQETLEAAIRTVTGEKLRVSASGRTDAGVHALAQVVGWRTESTLTADVLHRALNAELPNDIVVLSVEEAPPGFRAINDAKRKRYRYLVHDGRLADVFLRRWTWKVWDALDADKMHAAAQLLVGEHDFSSFQSSGSERKTTVRTVYELSVARDGVRDALRELRTSSGRSDVIVFEIEADGFLYNMVRAIVGALVEIGRGMKDEAWLRAVIAACDRRQAAATAPPQGLWLVRVDY